MPGECEICVSQRDGGETVRHRGIRRHRHAIGVHGLKITLQLDKVVIVLVIHVSGARQREVITLCAFSKACVVPLYFVQLVSLFLTSADETLSFVLINYAILNLKE